MPILALTRSGCRVGLAQFGHQAMRLFRSRSSPGSTRRMENRHRPCGRRRRLRRTVASRRRNGRQQLVAGGMAFPSIYDDLEIVEVDGEDAQVGGFPRCRNGELMLDEFIEQRPIAQLVHGLW